MQKRIRQEERQDYRQKNKRGDIEKWDQTDSPEIPDRGRLQKSPGLPSGLFTTCCRANCSTMNRQHNDHLIAIDLCQLYAILEGNVHF